MAAGKRWTRDELLILLNLYVKLPFGSFDQSQPVIRDVARRMERTPGSVAMKLCNLASLDPALRERGRKGLPGASDLDRQVWEEFSGNREAFAPVSEQAFRQLFGAGDDDEVEVVKGIGVLVAKQEKALYEGPTSAVAQVNVRLAQGVFRQMILNAYDGKCGITGIPIRELLVASHIRPWSKFPEDRLDERNGLCLSRLHDAAFDRGLITFGEDRRLILSKRLKDHLPQQALRDNFVAHEGSGLQLPPQAVGPKVEFLEYHREKVFQSW
jgi:putative restriction endonuclease